MLFLVCMFFFKYPLFILLLFMICVFLCFRVVFVRDISIENEIFQLLKNKKFNFLKIILHKDTI